MFGLGTGEVVLIVIVAFILFGPQKLPEIARGLGRAIRRFKEETTKMTEEVKKSTEDPTVKKDVPADKL